MRTGGSGSRIRVLHVCEAFSTGVLQSISQLCRHAGDDIDHHVLHGRRWETPADFRARFPDDVTFHEWSTERRPDLRGDIAAAQALRRLVDDLQPDIVHAHSSKAGALVRMALRRRGLRLLYSPRGFGFLRRDLGWPARSAYLAAEWLLGRSDATVVACGEGEAAVAQRVARRVIQIDNMIDLEDFADIPLTRQSGSPLRIAMSGSIRPQKNFPLFAEIAGRLADTGMTFVWIGGGDVPAGIAVPSNVSITGMLPRDEALRQLAASHVFMQTSLWEGLPIAVLEAMALETAVLAYPCIGNRELVIPGESGFLCRSGEEFAERLRWLDSDREALAALGAGSRRMAENRYSTDVVADRWREFYRSPKAALRRGPIPA